MRPEEHGFTVDADELVARMMAAAFKLPIDGARTMARDSEARQGFERAADAAVGYFCERLNTWKVRPPGQDQGKVN